MKYKLIILTADGAMGYREEKYKFYPDRGDNAERRDQWLSSGEKLEFAPGEESKLQDHLLHELNVFMPVDITELVDMRDEIVWISLNSHNYTGKSLLYFKEPQSPAQSQDLDPEDIYLDVIGLVTSNQSKSTEKLIAHLKQYYSITKK